MADSGRCPTCNQHRCRTCGACLRWWRWLYAGICGNCAWRMQHGGHPRPVDGCKDGVPR